MRLWHLLGMILMLACVMTIARDAIGRVAIVVFVTGLGEFVLGTTAVMMLFRTVGAIGEAKRLGAYLQAIVATIVVLVLASVMMNSVLWLGIRIVQSVVSEWGT